MKLYYLFIVKIHIISFTHYLKLLLLFVFMNTYSLKTIQFILVLLASFNSDISVDVYSQDAEQFQA